MIPTLVLFLLIEVVPFRSIERLLDNLSDYNYKTSFSAACRKRHKGTGQWLFGCSEFQEWAVLEEPSGLWVHGIRKLIPLQWVPDRGLTSRVAGSGKTVLAAGIIEYLFSLTRGGGISISYFFCTLNDRISRDPRVILRSLIRQILNVFNQTPAIGETMKSMFLTPSMEPSVNELSIFLASVTQLTNTSYLVIDGLDECEDSARREILTCLAGLIRDGAGRIKVIILSRWMDDSEPLKDFRQISLQSAGNLADIEEYIRQMVDESIEDGTITIRAPSMAEVIKRVLISKTNGT